MSLRKIGKTLGDKTYTWHSKIKKWSKKHNSRVVRRHLNRNIFND